MNQKRHTIKTRQMSRVVDNLKCQQARLRRRWLDIDIVVNALQHDINRELARFHK